MRGVFSIFFFFFVSRNSNKRKQNPKPKLGVPEQRYRGNKDTSPLQRLLGHTRLRYLPGFLRSEDRVVDVHISYFGVVQSQGY